MVVTEEGFPLSYEVFEGNRADVTTLEEILDSVERKHGALGRVWVFDRGIVSEENLALLRERGASYLVATPKRKLSTFQKELIKEDWIPSALILRSSQAARARRGALRLDPQPEPGRKGTRHANARAARTSQRSGQTEQERTQPPGA